MAEMKLDKEFAALSPEGFAAIFRRLKLDEFVQPLAAQIGEMQPVKRPNENPSVCLLLCPSSNKFEVAYALDRTMSPILVAEYERLLIPAEVLKKELDEYCQFIKDDVIES